MHSDADAGLPYVREADAAVRLPGNAPADTYLRIDLLVDAARRSGADAVHPGYGFLSENADFARAVIDAGLTWVGPTPESIEAMGSKIEAKRIMREAGVPVLEAPASADRGRPSPAGQGLRRRRRPRDARRASPRRPRRRGRGRGGRGAVGVRDGTVFVEPYVERGRHVEVQVFGDARVSPGRAGLLDPAPPPEGGRGGAGTRACPRTSATRCPRRRQKAAARPSTTAAPGPSSSWWTPRTSRFWFLEMNTRLQVEHPVTELVWGVDLVAAAAARERPRDSGGAARPRPRDRGAALRRGPGRRLPAAVRRAEPLRDPGEGMGSASTRGTSPARPSPRSTTRCWPRSSVTRRPARRPPASSPTPSPAPASTASSPTATCWSRCCGRRRSCGAR